MRYLKTVRQRLMFFVGVLSVTAITLVSAGGINVSKRLLNEQLAEKAQDNLQAILSIMNMRKQESLHSAKTLSTRKDVAQAVEFADFNLLQKTLQPLLEQSGMEYLVVTNSEGRVLYRAHRPDEIPAKDDNIYNQWNIQRALAGEETVGIEEGAVVKLSLRAGAPVHNAFGDIIGALSTGYTISSNSIVDEACKMTGGVFSFFAGKDRISSSTLEESGKRLVTPLSQELFPTGKPAKTPAPILHAEDPELGASHHSVFTPLVGTDGTVVGALESSLSYDQVAAVRRSAINSTLIIGVSLLLLFMLACWPFVNSITRPLLRLRLAMTRVESGDLSAHAEVMSDGELAELTATFNQMTQQQAATVRQIRESSDFVQHASQEIANTTMEVTAATEEAAASVDSVSQLMRKGRDLAETATGKLQELASLIAATFHKGQSVLESSQETLRTAESGRKIAAEAVEAMDRAKDLSEDTERLMQILEENSRRISNITETITSIARQTNFLALNAAIEATRAGEAGKGFAVVADEVRQLAEESNKGASQVAELVARIVENTAGAMESIQKNRVEVENGFATVERTVKALEAISGATHETGSAIQEMVEMAQSEEENSRQLVKMIEGLLKSLDESAERAEEVSAMTEEVSSSAIDISARTQELSSIATELGDKVSLFQLPDAPSELSDEERFRQAKSDQLLLKIHIANMLKGKPSSHSEEKIPSGQSAFELSHCSPDSPLSKDLRFKSIETARQTAHEQARLAVAAHARKDARQAAEHFKKLEKHSGEVIKRLNRLLKKTKTRKSS